jgi:hypothetical protein
MNRTVPSMATPGSSTPLRPANCGAQRSISNPRFSACSIFKNYSATQSAREFGQSLNWVSPASASRCSAVPKTTRRCTLSPFGPAFHHRKHHTSGPSFRVLESHFPAACHSSSLRLRYRIRGALDGTRASSWRGAEYSVREFRDTRQCLQLPRQSSDRESLGTQRMTGHLECIRGAGNLS